ncbi:MAG: hypothetical protein Q9187_002179 [Circinaria calcarea]
MAPHPLVRYILHTSTQFPLQVSSTVTRNTTATWSTGYPRVTHALTLLPAEEQESVLRYHRPSDAALSLGSYILKHLAITRICGILWSASVLSRHPENGKPCYVAPMEDGMAVEFNVSHHGEVVVLVASEGNERQVGIDVVKVEMKGVEREGGWEKWVKVFEDVFSKGEIEILLGYEPVAPKDEKTKRMKMRLFYSYWALKEAYIKLTGEALLAKWLKELEFKRVRAPKEAIDGEWGEIIEDVEIWLRSEKVERVKMELQALGSEYMVATAVGWQEGGRNNFPSFEEIEVARDVFPIASKWES